VRGRGVGRGASIGGGVGDSLPLVLALEGGGDFAWGVVAGGGQGLKEPFACAWGLVMVGRWGALRESLRSGWGSGWGCVVGGVVVGGLTRGRSWGGDSCGRFDQGLGERVEGV